jgi:hypothetical protein
MKNTELRLGNHLQPVERQKAAYGCHLGIVTSIQEGHFIVCNHYPGHWFEPIPLTEEWLVKFGFDVNDDELTHNIKKANIEGFRINTYSDEDVKYWWLGYYHNKKNNHIKHVHQLQNLYFVLTGEELLLK